MNANSSDEALRARLRALEPPPAEAALRATLIAQAARHLPAARRRWWQALWRPALAAGVLIVAGLVGFSEYRAWQEVQELADLDTLSVATMLIL